MKPLFSNRVVDAAAKTLLCFGVLHLAILTLIAVHADVRVLNAFAILNLDMILPPLGDGAASFALSYGVVFTVYCLVYRRLTRPHE